MLSKKPGYEVRGGAALVVLGGKTLLPLLDRRHGPREPTNLIGDDGEVSVLHVQWHQCRWYDLLPEGATP